jgi:hypothetical protein
VLWKPDIQFVNGLNGYIPLSSVTTSSATFFESTTGVLKEIIYVQTQLRTPIYMADYPFDTQILEVQLGSFAYSICTSSIQLFNLTLCVAELRIHPVGEGLPLTEMDSQPEDITVLFVEIHTPKFFYFVQFQKFLPLSLISIFLLLQLKIVYFLHFIHSHVPL